MMHDAQPVVVTDTCPRDVAPRSLLERACMHWLRDGRDLVFCRLTLRATVTLVLCAVVVLAAPPWLA